MADRAGRAVRWPEEFAARYRREGYWRGDTLGGLLRRWAGTHGDRTALVAGERRWSYRDLDRRADVLASGVAALGIGAGDAVVVQLPNIPEFLFVCFALFRVGAVPVLALPPHRRAEVGHVGRVAGAVACVVPDTWQGYDHRALAREAAAEIPTLAHVIVAGDPGDPGDPGASPRFVALAEVERRGGHAEGRTMPGPRPEDDALFLLSGGTTGPPKLIPRTHDDYACNIRASAANAGLGPGDVYLAALPVAHNYALGCPGVLGTLAAGGTVVLAGTPSPDDAFPLIERERVTVTGLVPSLGLLWAEAAAWAGAGLSSLRLVQLGGAPVTPETARRTAAALGCRIQQSFGMAEGLLSQSPPDDPDELRMTAQGRPISPGDEVRVVGDDGADVPPGEQGELLVRGPYTIRGYHRADAYNRTAFTPDGFFRTGDLARRLPTGHLVVTGRVKDVINRGGDKVPADEVEDHILAHPGVRAAAVVGLPDDVLGERTCACVVPRGAPVDPAELRAFVGRRGMAAYKVPDRIEVVADLPYTPVGKVDKKRLRTMLAGRAPGDRS